MEWSLSDAGCDGSDGAVASTSAVIGAMSSGRPPRKWGLPVGGQHSTRVLLLRPFNLSHVAWLYTYSTHPDSFIWERPDGAWIGSVPEASQIPALLDEHGIEFVPMVSGRAFQPISVQPTRAVSVGSRPPPLPECRVLLRKSPTPSAAFATACRRPYDF